MIESKPVNHNHFWRKILKILSINRLSEIFSLMNFLSVDSINTPVGSSYPVAAIMGKYSPKKVSFLSLSFFNYPLDQWPTPSINTKWQWWDLTSLNWNIWPWLVLRWLVMQLCRSESAAEFSQADSALCTVIPLSLDACSQLLTPIVKLGAYLFH